MLLARELPSLSGDPWLRRAKSRIVIYASEVYHLLTHADLDENIVREAIRESKSIPIFIGGVGTVSERASSMTSRASISAEDLRAFANSLSFLFVLAYDGEGYLCWSKDSSHEYCAPGFSSCGYNHTSVCTSLLTAPKST